MAGPVLLVAPLLAIGLIGLYIYRRFMWWMEMKVSRLFTLQPAEEPLLEAVAQSWQSVLLEALLATCHYYSLLYVVCAYLIWDEYKSSYRILQPTSYLDPEILRERFRNETELPIWWEEEVKHMVNVESLGLLRYFSLSSPIFLCLTFLVSLLNTGRHVARMLIRGGLMRQNPGMDSSIMIIALPMIACMMSFRSVTRMWMICSNSTVGSLATVEDFQGRATWLARLVVCQNNYETNFLMSDLYESWALLHFANLALSIIENEHRRRHSRMRDSTMQLEEKRTESINLLTKQGIYLFNGTCFLEAAYSLLTTSVEAFFGGERSMQFNERVYRSRSHVHYFFLGTWPCLIHSKGHGNQSETVQLLGGRPLFRCFKDLLGALRSHLSLPKTRGMGTIASTAAIGNVVTVELTFKDLLRDFRPSAKFWSTKILISIGFIQTLLLEIPPLSSHLSITERDLFYASLLCLECFFVSLLHVIAWDPREPWLWELKQGLE